MHAQAGCNTAKKSSRSTAAFSFLCEGLQYMHATAPVQLTFDNWVAVVKVMAMETALRWIIL